MAIHNMKTQPTPDILIKSGLTLGNASSGMYTYRQASVSGAIANFDFAGNEVLRLVLTGNITTDAVPLPPLGVPSLTVNGQQLELLLEIQQDGTGNRTFPTASVFANANSIQGSTTVLTAANAITPIRLVASRVLGSTVWDVFMPPLIHTDQLTGGPISTSLISGLSANAITSGAFHVDRIPALSAAKVTSGTFEVERIPDLSGAKITSGTIPIARIQDGTTGQKGVVQIGTSSAQVSAGNHVHASVRAVPFVIFQSGGTAITNGDYTVLSDVPTAGTIVRLTDAYLSGGTTPTGTIAVKIGSTEVTGISAVAIDETPSADADATAANTFSARAAINVTLSSLSGSPVMMRGMLHISTNTAAP